MAYSELVITYKEFDRVSFPIFKLPSANWSEQDGLVYLDGSLLDDRNMPGETLGIRRLQTPFKDLIVLKKSLLDVIGLIKQPPSAYVDNVGFLFTYEKTTMASLKYHKIRKVERKDVATILWLKDINFPFKQKRPPLPENTWAGVLYIQGIPWLIYEFSETKKSDTRRKI